MASLHYLSKVLFCTPDDELNVSEMVSHSMEIILFNLLPYIPPSLLLFVLLSTYFTTARSRVVLSFFYSQN